MGERLRPADAAWLRMDRPENLMIVNAVMWFDGEMDWSAFRGEGPGPTICHFLSLQ